jgi:hypothetical protein
MSLIDVSIFRRVIFRRRSAIVLWAVRRATRLAIFVVGSLLRQVVGGGLIFYGAQPQESPPADFQEIAEALQ